MDLTVCLFARTYKLQMLARMANWLTTYSSNLALCSKARDMLLANSYFVGLRQVIKIPV